MSQLLNDGVDVKTYVIEVDMCHTPEESAYSPNWPNGCINLDIIITTIHLEYPVQVPVREYEIPKIRSYFWDGSHWHQR